MPSTLGETSDRPFRWSNEQFLALIEAGIVPNGNGIELIDGQLMETGPQGECHLLLFWALQRALASFGGFDKGLAVRPTVVLHGGNVFDPEFAILSRSYRPESGLPKASDVLFVAEVAVSALRYDLGAKKSAYAVAGIRDYWVVDGNRRGVWAFSDPVNGAYLCEEFFGAESDIQVPVLGKMISLASIFPTMG